MKKNKLSVWFYKQKYYTRILIVIGLFLLYSGLIVITFFSGLIAGIEYITYILLFIFTCSFIFLFLKFSSYFLIPFLIGGIIILLGSVPLGEPCNYFLKGPHYHCDCSGIKQYDLFSARCIGERKSCGIGGEETSCEDIDNYFNNRR